MSQVRKEVDPDRLRALTDRMVADAGGSMALHLGLIGDRLGLFAALADGGPLTPGELADRTGTAERYVRDWCLTMAASGYITYAGGGDKRTARYELSPEQAEAFTHADGSGYVAGMFQSLTAATRMTDRLAQAFRTGAGIPWGEQHADMFEGTERFFRAAYMANLTGSWIPSLTGMAERLGSGSRVADVGCGFGTSTIIMARAYPNSAFVGIDAHAPSIEAARERAEAAGVAGRVEFRTAAAEDLDGDFDLVTFFDCLHDMPDPLTALRAARAALRPAGRVMAVEPISWDSVEETANPVGRLLVGVSMFVCLPSGLSAPPATGLGSQPGPRRLLELAGKAGFGEARVATGTDVHLVYEFGP
ncbi:Methyltransferase domain-containing protein [Nonomuraea maritima]|uniref:Methyltransferase domain-containing protein n=1 Tax=Nonomuraea maritima TaxID=683260 RepID=A0A1G9K116_9ACTN|nr:class I SAM-dependent methyltransferase [Nonomuraea maritima]SDL43382.1 Methyltransferase domain-containing protein [Nonomuraea maritima]